MIRVAVVIDSLKVGGAQRLMAAYASHATARGLVPIIITLREDGAPFIQESIRSSGIQAVSLRASSLFDVRRFWKLVETLKCENIQVVQSHLTYSNILAVLAARSAGIPAIATLHSMSVRHGWKAKVLKLFENYVLRRFATRILAVGQIVADLNQGNYGGRRVDVIPNGITKPQFPQALERARLRREIAGDGPEPIIITVGRFSKAKGYEDMIRAISMLCRKDCKSKLLMVGSGSNFEAIRNQIEDLDLRQSVILAGEREDVHHLLALSDVYASSSHREGLPLSVLEAMMAGLPIVATSVGDIPNVVTEETGVVVPPHRPDLLAEALEELLKNPKKRQSMGQAAYWRAMDEYSVDVWMDRHLALYHEVLSTNRRGNSK